MIMFYDDVRFVRKWWITYVMVSLGLLPSFVCRASLWEMSAVRFVCICLV